MSRYYIRRRYYGSAGAIESFNEEQQEGGRKRKKGSLLKKAAAVGAAGVAAAAGTKYGAKAYGKRQSLRAKAARSAGLVDKARKIEGGRLTKYANKVGSVGDKKIGQAKSYVSKKITQGRRKLAGDKDQFDRQVAASAQEKKAARLERKKNQRSRENKKVEEMSQKMGRNSDRRAGGRKGIRGRIGGFINRAKRDTNKLLGRS